MKGLVFLTCVCVAWGAPAKNTDKEVKELESIKNTENEIEQLANLAAATGKDNVGIQKQESFAYHNSNGLVDSKAQTESKVFNSKTGDVISDLQQETLGGSKTKTKLDIPAANIHQSVISQSDEADALPRPDYDYAEAFRFTPAAVAEYLFRSGEFEELEEALSDLVNSSIMTQQQADTYREDVRKEYNTLVQQATAASNMNLQRQRQPNNRFLSDYSTLNDIYRMFGYNDVIPNLGIDELQNKEIMKMALSRASSLIEVIRTLMDEWLAKATITGDPDAAALLSDILRHVSKDSNPDDLSQMRDILYDIFANEVLNSLEKRPLGDYEDVQIDDSMFGMPPAPVENESNKVKQETEIKQEQSNKDANTEEENAKTEKEIKSTEGKEIKEDKVKM